jgi:hypothetical protein
MHCLQEYLGACCKRATMSIAFCEHSSPHRVCSASLGTTAPTHAVRDRSDVHGTTRSNSRLRPCVRGAPQVLPCSPPLARRTKRSVRLLRAFLSASSARQSARGLYACGLDRHSDVRDATGGKGQKVGTKRIAHARARALTQADGCPVPLQTSAANNSHSSVPREPGRGGS